MKIKMKFIINLTIPLTVIIFLLIGCVSKESIITEEYLEQQILEIDYSNGINKKEATLLAQIYILKNPPDKTKYPAKADIDLNQFQVVKLKDKFNIQFDFKFESGKPFMYPFYWAVNVDRTTGEILFSGFKGHK